jgi:hypothetical protein
MPFNFTQPTEPVTVRIFCVARWKVDAGLDLGFCMDEEERERDGWEKEERDGWEKEKEMDVIFYVLPEA